MSINLMKILRFSLLIISIPIYTQSNKEQYSISINQKYIEEWSYNKNSTLINAIKLNDFQKLKTLINNATNVNEIDPKDIYGYLKTPLMIATEKENIKIMQLLINAGANVNAIWAREQPHAGKPILQFAIEVQNIDALKLLIENGANVNEYTENPFLYIDGKLNLSTRNIPLISSAINSNISIEIINELINGNANINQVDMLSRCWTPLMIASYKGNMPAVKALINAGADKNIKNKKNNNKTALDYAKEQKHTEIILLLSSDKN